MAKQPRVDDFVFLTPFEEPQDPRIKWREDANDFVSRWHELQDELSRTTRLSSDMLERRLGMLEQGIMLLLTRV